MSGNGADTGVCSEPEENEWGTPTGSVGAQGLAVCVQAIAPCEATAVSAHDTAAGEGIPGERSKYVPLAPFTIVEEPVHALSWKDDPYPGWTRITSIMDSGACASVAPVSMAPGVPIEESE